MAVVLVASKPSAGGRGLATHATKVINQCYTLAFTLVFLVYPGCSQGLFSYLNCDTLDGPGEDGLAFMRQDFAVDCASSMYRSWLAYVLLMIMVYPLGVPLMFCIVFYKSRHALRRMARAESLSVASAKKAALEKSKHESVRSVKVIDEA